MYRGLTVSVVIPCYNEEKGIQDVLQKMPSYVDDVVVIDNNSTDATSALATGLGAKVVFEPQRGYGRAYKTGFSAASGDIIATLDRDGTYPSVAIAPMIDFMVDNNLDFVSACRFPLRERNAMSLRNIIGNKVQTYAMRLLYFTTVKDSQSGMWVFKRALLEAFRLRSNGMSFSEEIKIEALRWNRGRFGECHIDYYERIGKTKLYPWRDGIMNMWFLFRKRILR